MTVRAGPITSAAAGPSCRTHIMLNRMCRKWPCSQLALSTVHHRPRPKTGKAPLAPSSSSACWLGAKMASPGPSVCSAAPDRRSDARYRIDDAPTTNGYFTVFGRVIAGTNVLNTFLGFQVWKETPQGQHAVEKTNDLNQALTSLRGRTIDAVRVMPTAPGSYALSIAAGDVEVRLTFDRQEATLRSINVGGGGVGE